MRYSTMILLTIPPLMVMGLCLWIGAVVAFEVPFHLGFGWMAVVWRSVRELEVDRQAWLTILVCVVFLGTGLHFLARWLNRAVPGTTKSEWSWRRSFVLGGASLLLAVAGICMVGVTHQVFWMASSERSLLERKGHLRSRTLDINNLKQIMLGMHAHHDIYKKFPPGVVFNSQGRMLHGWPVLMLPYIEQNALFQKIDRKLPWDDPGHHELFSQIVPTYANFLAETQVAEDGKALLHYAGNIRLLGSDKAWQLRDIKDGTSNTIMMGMIGEGIRPWGYPYHARDPALGLNAGPGSFGNLVPNLPVSLALADGTVRTVMPDVSPQVLKALATPAGGEDVKDQDW